MTVRRVPSGSVRTAPPPAADAALRQAARCVGARGTPGAVRVARGGRWRRGSSGGVAEVRRLPAVLLFLPFPLSASSGSRTLPPLPADGPACRCLPYRLAEEGRAGGASARGRTAGAGESGQPAGRCAAAHLWRPALPAAPRGLPGGAERAPRCGAPAPGRALPEGRADAVPGGSHPAWGDVFLPGPEARGCPALTLSTSGLRAAVGSRWPQRVMFGRVCGQCRMSAVCAARG